MSPPNTIAATPARFHLSLRLVDDQHRPFKNTSYRVTWGLSTSSGTTSADGRIDIVVDGSPGVTRGTCELGTGSGKKFEVKIRIPLVMVQPDNGPPGSYRPPSKAMTEIMWRLDNLGFVAQAKIKPEQTNPPHALLDAMHRFHCAEHEKLGNKT